MFNSANVAAANKSSEAKTDLDAINTSQATTTGEDDSNDTRLIAHRGYSAIAPENTMAAFQAAVDSGFDAIELDVNWTKDGVPVVIHDDKINRTARNENGSRLFFAQKCSDLTYEELLKYDFGSSFSADFKGEKIPTLYEVVEFAKDNDVELYIELKKTKNFDNSKAQMLLDNVEKLGLSDKVTWISYQDDYLKTISDLDNDARLGYLTKKSINQDILEILDEINTDENEVFLDIKSSKVREKGIDILSESGYDFEAWTVDSQKESERLNSHGCRGITTNGGLLD